MCVRALGQEVCAHTSTPGLWRNDFPFLLYVCVQVYVTFDTNIGSAEVYNEGGVSVKRCIEVQERQGVPLPL